MFTNSRWLLFNMDTEETQEMEGGTENEIFYTDDDVVTQELEVSAGPKKRKRLRFVAHEWSDGEIIKLIESVEMKPELWKCNHVAYKNRNKKDSAWRDIEENVFNSVIRVQDIQTKWNNLRVQYKSYAAKYKNKPSGSGRGNV